MSVGNVAWRVNWLMNYSKVKLFYKFKLWWNSSCVVGVNVLISESRCVTSVLKKFFSESLVSNCDEKNLRKSCVNCVKKFESVFASKNPPCVFELKVIQSNLLPQGCSW